ncbi:MAG: protein kinase [Candidatus Krumholzibacteria bacterium]|nr:protein kinase [Candidatus Krumholzibacteria bacterium]
MIGKTLAHYQITDKLGEGGMGEVYRARDTKLGRDVALKLLPALFANDPERLARMQREAKLLAAVNHPSIAAIHGIEEDQGQKFLVMEVAEGEDLSDRIKAGPLRMSEALDIAYQIAEGLEEAHAKGVVHRDLKPANVVVSAEGKVKVLDFGLATTETGELPDEMESAHSPTITAMLTQTGTILGTAAYMSPEQARGYPADKRSDIWAFGIILFEMLTGKQLIQGDTVSDKLAAILKSPPDWDALPATTAPRIRDLLERCLAKHRRDRLQDIGDARLEIEWTQQGRTGALSDSATGGRGIPAVRAILAAVLLCAVVGFGAWSLGSMGGQSTTDSPSTRRLVLEFPDDLQIVNTLTAPSGLQGLVGRPRNAKNEDYRVYFRNLDSFETLPVAGSAGVTTSCFSHDSTWFAMIAPDKSQSTGMFLWKLPVDQSSPPLRVRSWPDEWEMRLHWLRDGNFVTRSYEGELVRISSDGQVVGSPAKIKPPEFGAQFSPGASFGTELPDGVHLLDGVDTWSENGYALHIGLANILTGETSLIIQNGSNPRWLKSGHIVFSRGNSILALPFDLKTLETRGGPIALGDGLRINAAWQHGEFGISATGDLFYHDGGLVGQNRQLAWTDPEFKTYTSWSDDRRSFEMPPILSPDGSAFVTLVASATGLFEIWISETSQSSLRRLISEKGRDCYPRIWSPDGTALVYTSFAPGQAVVKTLAIDGGSQPVTLFAANGVTDIFQPTSFADGGEAMLVTQSADGKSRILYYPFGQETDGTPPTREILAAAADGVISPDGGWLAYTSDATGRPVVYLRKWLGEGELGPEITVAPGTSPNWFQMAADAPPEIWFRDQGRYHVVSLEAGPRVRLSKPRFGVEITGRLQGFDIDRQGRVLALLNGDDETAPKKMNVVLGWEKEIQGRLTAGQ